MAPRRRNLTMEDATLGLSPAEIRCLLCALLSTKFQVDFTALAKISGSYMPTAQRLYNKAMQKLRQAQEGLEQQSPEVAEPQGSNEEVVS
ncbi:hypothetical protein N7493_002664 [Penicillium malachiteum]|uniref:Uncharacterized protein n=1 Tax=Penicillium malachiteum TaxID=1324776 RepID=A0AAD6HSX8_9EURO|nr:hypothetical protein N7493_002664 [Penicillium malachiteum]